MDSEEKESLVFYYHPDHLGSTSYVTDADGNIAQHVEYIPYGEIFVEERNNQFSTNYLFNAKELDNETGLYYYGARYLDPTGAMWLSVDPLFEKYAGMSPYNYCMGNPVKLVDPDGRNVEGKTEDDAVKFHEDINTVIADSRFDNFRSLISRNGNKISFNYEKFRYFRINQVKDLSEDDLALIDIVAEGLSTPRNTQVIHYAKMADKLDDYGKDFMLKGLYDVLKEEGRIYQYISGGSATIITNNNLNSKSCMVEDAAPATDYYQRDNNIHIESFKSQRCVTSFHEVFGHGYSGIRNVGDQHEAAILFENLTLRVMGINAYRSGADHGTRADIKDPHKLPSFVPKR